MQLRSVALPANSYGKRLATPGLAEAIRRLFFRLSRSQNQLARSAAVDGVREEFNSVDMKKFLVTRFIAIAALLGIAGCAQMKKPPAQGRAVPAGVRFDQVGMVTLFPGEPCTPPIM